MLDTFITLVALFGGLYLLLQVIALRCMLSIVFSTTRARPPPDATAPDGAAKQYAAADAELRALREHVAALRAQREAATMDLVPAWAQ